MTWVELKQQQKFVTKKKKGKEKRKEPHPKLKHPRGLTFFFSS